jgi:hypothetical protein
MLERSSRDQDTFVFNYSTLQIQRYMTLPLGRPAERYPFLGPPPIEATPPRRLIERLVQRVEDDRRERREHAE